MYDCNLSKFEKGTRVKVVTDIKYKTECLLGLSGTVHGVYGRSVGVKLDDKLNSRSTIGVFYLEKSDLEIIDDYENNIMEENHMNSITNYLNIAKIRFVDGNNSRVYEYANFEPDLKVGDICVVMSANHGLGVAEVVEIVYRNDLKTQREVVAKVCTDSYDRRVKDRAKAAELRAKMQERAKKLQDIALYQMLAKDDPEMAQFLEDYRNIPIC